MGPEPALRWTPNRPVFWKNVVPHPAVRHTNIFGTSTQGGKNQKRQAPIKPAQPFSAPELRAENCGHELFFFLKKKEEFQEQPFSAVLRLSRIFSIYPENLTGCTKHFGESVSGLVPKIVLFFGGEGWVVGEGWGRGEGVDRALGVAKGWFRLWILGSCLGTWWLKQGVFFREFSADPNPQYFLKSIAVQMGGVLPYKWEVYCCVSLSSRLRSQEGTAIQMGGVLP